MRNDQAKYGKDLSTTTGIRLTETLRDQTKKSAKFKGMSFKEFCDSQPTSDPATNVNIAVWKFIEKAYALRNAEADSKHHD